MIDRRIPPCYNCGAWNDEREGCTMSAPDRQYACPLEYEGKEDTPSALPEAFTEQIMRRFTKEE